MKGTDKQMIWAEKIIAEAEPALKKGHDRFDSENDSDMRYAWKMVSEEVEEIISSTVAGYIVERRKSCVDPEGKTMELFEVITEARKLIDKGEISKESLESAIEYYEGMLKAIVQCEQRDTVKDNIRNCELAIWAIDNPKMQ